jgi:hypothetical protein
VTHADTGHYAAKHPPGTRVSERLTRTLQQEARQHRLTCRQAHDIARRLGVTPKEVGVAVDLMECRIVRCQLGLFGYHPRKKGFDGSVENPAGLTRIIETLPPGERLPCLAAWEMADQLGCARMAIGAGCDRKGIKIGPCQLGAF